MQCWWWFFPAPKSHSSHCIHYLLWQLYQISLNLSEINFCTLHLVNCKFEWGFLRQVLVIYLCAVISVEGCSSGCWLPVNGISMSIIFSLPESSVRTGMPQGGWGVTQCQVVYAASWAEPDTKPAPSTASYWLHSSDNRLTQTWLQACCQCHWGLSHHPLGWVKFNKNICFPYGTCDKAITPWPFRWVWSFDTISLYISWSALA